MLNTFAFLQDLIHYITNNNVWTILLKRYLTRFIYSKYHFLINKRLFIISLFIEIYSIYTKSLLFFIVFNCLFINSIFDYINNDVYSILNYIIAIAGLLLNNLTINNLYSLLLPLALAVVNRFIKGMGLGDIELLICLCFIFKIQELTTIVLLASFLNILYACLVRETRYPFVIFLSLSSLLIWLILGNF